MRNKKAIFVLCSLLVFLMLSGCDLTKKVPKGKYLLKENKLDIPKKYDLKEDKLRGVIRQKPNYKSAGMKLKLVAFNMVDSSAVAAKRERKNQRILKKNRKRRAKEKKINERRIKRALKKGKTVYRPKEKKMKDTINPSTFFREWLKYEFGEPPVIFDSLTMELTLKQLQLYLQRKGYFNGSVKTEVAYNDKKQKANPTFIFEPGTAYMVDSVFLRTNNQDLRTLFNYFQVDNPHALKSPFQFDADQLGKMRNELAEFYRDETIYGFRSSYISFEVDSLNRDSTLALAIQIAPRVKKTEEDQTVKTFRPTKVNDVHFHILDTNFYEGNFKKEQLEARNIRLAPRDRIPTFDTLHYDWYDGNNKAFRKATFYYNGTLKISPELIEFQNLLEAENWYRGKNVDQSFNRLIQLNLFQSIVPEIVEQDNNRIDVHYYLTPSKHQSFSFVPRATHSNGFLGVASSVNYQHKNIFGGGENLKISFSGGLESQPEIFDQGEDNTGVIGNASAGLNTIEIGPSIELDIPGLFPMSISKLSKRQLPKTNIAISYNFQKREEFARNLFQFNYLWKFADPKRSQTFTLGLPFLGGLQYVEVFDESTAFLDRLESQNDLFLLNAYSNQFIWKDLKFIYQYTNQKTKSGDLLFSYTGNLDIAGNIVALLTRDNSLNEDGFKEFLGVRYAQFARLDNDIRFSYPLGGERSLNHRIEIGAGIPYENNGPNLPFDYSFFAGGANDNRGFRARSLGPGVYKYYLDTNRTATEIGDIRFGGSLEYRFKISGMFKGAVFTDFGNIWNFNEDENRPGGQFTKDWYKQLALAVGVGLRIDLDFLVFRLDLGFPIRHPALPESSQWIFQSRDAYIQEGIDVFGTDYKEYLPNPFAPQLHIGIGYPF